MCGKVYALLRRRYKRIVNALMCTGMVQLQWDGPVELVEGVWA